MRILFTGASSFTGCWFATELARAGHEVVATFTRTSPDDYAEPIRRERVKRVTRRCQTVYSCRFGNERFVDVIRDEGVDLLCHHAADVKDYKNPDFDVATALANNTKNIRSVLEAIATNHTGRLVLTGSVFEGGEGAGSEGLPHISPYGLSKSLTAQAVAYFCNATGVPWGKFVVPNPFGPWEEPRFTAYLMRAWSEGQTPAIRTPDYVRDNIPVSLLAAAYVDFVSRDFVTTTVLRARPSGYVESQGAFAERLAHEVRERTGWDCALEHGRQTDFTEPLVRVNTDRVLNLYPDWSESSAWDAMVDFYVRSVKPCKSPTVA
jgi:nucleoside-diphosphate-sugar epimerase